MKPNSDYLKLKHSIIYASLVGPLMLILARSSGANFWDGLFGTYSNSPMQENLIKLGLWAPIIVTITSILVCFHYARKSGNNDKRFVTRLLPLSVFVPFPLMVLFLFIFMAT